mmetsp:Transcript_9857/g.12904  ORF Transcript_9857/g.12904 Transcript_9857/m.12904 type:complete len:132 (-) Transcript_9857:135-530(-)|eukprot:CAMPEP_0117800860 /NCGR_PEP_ID=MMETSP0948-20121206/14734_1 /TAXON_ID=44440 /ORGANISM="Chattonella subsalsa, Strain CCMP2191" /LENGTH=131 /DNA_ID=CAMNT_0005633245 /DNA_START=220 /DNA_END=615 /DNA_ORIENTATION=+
MFFAAKGKDFQALNHILLSDMGMELWVSLVLSQKFACGIEGEIEAPEASAPRACFFSGREKRKKAFLEGAPLWQLEALVFASALPFQKADTEDSLVGDHTELKTLQQNGQPLGQEESSLHRVPCLDLELDD